jgi:uncharacterized protein (TIGR03083 family)
VSLEPTTLIGIAHAERARLGRTIQYTEPAAWDAPSPCRDWTNRDVLAHLAAQETAAAQAIAGEPAEEFDAFREANGGELWVDGFNEWAIGVRDDRSARAMITDWGRAADLFCSRAADLEPERWSTMRVPWVAGEIGVRYLVQSRIIEWWLHGEDLREGTGQRPNPQHWPVHLTCDMGIRMLPYALGRAGLSFPGMSVQVDLSGMGGGSWHWGLAGREGPSEDKKPDAFIEGRAHAFALVAARRTAGTSFLDDGNLVIGGDEGIASAVLEHIRAFVG